MDYGAVADGDDNSDVEVMEMSDIEEEAEGDDANAAPEKGKRKSRSRKKEGDGCWLKVSLVLYFPPQRCCYLCLRCIFCLQRVVPRRFHRENLTSIFFLVLPYP